MTLRVTLIHGGGAGDDQVPAVKDVLKAAGVAIDWDEHPAGWAALHQGRKVAISDELLASVRSNRVGLKTKLLPEPGDPGKARKARRNYNVELRRALNLFAM